MIENVFTQRDFSGGLNTTFKPWQLDDKELPLVRNMMISSRGSIESAQGFKSAGTASSSILGLFPYYIYIYVPAYLTGGSSATSVVATWSAVTDGSFRITIDGTQRDITGLNFSACTTMAEVAAVIQTGVRGATSSQETVTWVTDHFVITGGSTVSATSFTVTSAVGSGTDISGAGGTAFMDADSGHGTVTEASLTTANTRRLIRIYGTAVEYTVNPLVATPTWTSIETLPISGGRFGAVQYDNKLWYGDGVNDFRSLSNTTVSTVSGAPKGNIIAVWRSQCWIAGNSTNPSTVYYSSIDSFTTWSGGTSGSLTVNKRDGQAVTGLVPLGDNLIVFKERSIWKISYDYDDVTGTNFYSVTEVSAHHGSIASRTAILVNNDATALSNFGVVTVGQVANYSGLRTNVLSEKIRDDLKTRTRGGAINEDYANLSAAAFYEDRLYLSIPIEDATSPSSTYVYDSLYESWVYLEGVAANIFCMFRASQLEDYLFFGSNDGGVYYFAPNHNFNGVAYTKRFQTKRNNLGNPGVKKEVHSAVISGAKSIGSTINGIYVRDYASEEFTITDDDLIQNTSGGHIGENYFGENYFGGAGVADGTPQYRYRKIFMPDERYCYEFQLDFQNDEADEPYSVDSIQVSYGTADFQEDLTS